MLRVIELQSDIRNAKLFLKASGNSLPCGEQDRIVDVIEAMEEELQSLTR